LIDTKSALESRANLEWIAGKWWDLRARLRKSGGDPNAPRVKGSKEPPLEIDLHVSDLLHEITTEAVLWGRILIEEADWRQEHGEMPGLLVDVASQYGHFVCDEDEKVAYDFTDTAAEFRRKVEGVLNRPEPVRYIGPCFAAGCQGEIYARDEEGGRCRECDEPWTLTDQRFQLWREMDTVLFEYGEVLPALKMLGLEVSGRTWERWTSSGTQDRPKEPKIAKEDDLYPFGQAVRLAAAQPKYRDTAIGRALA